MYDFIVDPYTNLGISIFSKKGKKILNKYLITSLAGGDKSKDFSLGDEAKDITITNIGFEWPSSLKSNNKKLRIIETANNEVKYMKICPDKVGLKCQFNNNNRVDVEKIHKITDNDEAPIYIFKLEPRASIDDNSFFILDSKKPINIDSKYLTTEIPEKKYSINIDTDKTILQEWKWVKLDNSFYELAKNANTCE